MQNENNDLISRKALREKIKTLFWSGSYKSTILQLIDNAPTVKPCDNCDLYFKAMTKEEMRKGGAE